MYRSDYMIQEIAVLDQPGHGRCAVPDPPCYALGVFDTESTIGITVGVSYISYIARRGCISECPETLRYFLAKDRDPAEPHPSLHYLGRTSKGVHVWTNLPRAN